jgi:hypothetical protein
MTNPITEGFKEHLNTKKLLVMVSPGKLSAKPRSVSLIYDDGSEETFVVDLAHTEFIAAWKNFSRWFARFVRLILKIHGQTSKLSHEPEILS